MNYCSPTLRALLMIPFIFLALSSCRNNETHDSSQQQAMFMSDAQHTGTYSSSPVLTQPEVAWKVKTGGEVISSPVISNDVVYTGSADSSLYAIDAGSGDILWKFKTGGPIHSTPLIAQGKVMFLSYDGFFYALNQSDGALLWKFETGGESRFKVKDYYNGSFKEDFWDFYLSSAVVTDDLVCFGSSDSTIYALTIDSGEQAWSYKTNGSIHTSPAHSEAENILVAGSWDSNIYGLDSETGEEKWVFSTGKDLESYIWLGIQASPSIDDGVVYIGSRDAKFYALDVKTGDTVWTKDAFDRSWMPSTAAIGDSAIYTGSSDSFSFFSIDKKTGDINYKTHTNAYTFSSPAIDNNMAYIGSANGRLYGIDLASGNIQWEFQTTGARTDTLYLFNRKGEIDRERFKRYTTNITDMPTLNAFMTKAFIGVGAILSSPSISDQVIYFGSSDGYIYAVSDKK